MASIATSRPDPGECDPSYSGYVVLVPQGDIIETLESQVRDTMDLLGGLTPEQAGYRYAPGKWSMREVVGHMTDSERVFAMRALAFARLDPGPLPGFEQDDYVSASNFDEQQLGDLLAEFATVRNATVSLYRSFSDEMWLRGGIANGVEFTVRVIAHILAGHERHHLAVLKDRYLS